VFALGAGQQQSYAQLCWRRAGSARIIFIMRSFIPALKAQGILNASNKKQAIKSCAQFRKN